MSYAGAGLKLKQILLHTCRSASAYAPSYGGITMRAASSSSRRLSQSKDDKFLKKPKAKEEKFESPKSLVDFVKDESWCRCGLCGAGVYVHLLHQHLKQRHHQMINLVYAGRVVKGANNELWIYLNEGIFEKKHPRQGGTVKLLTSELLRETTTEDVKKKKTNTEKNQRKRDAAMEIARRNEEASEKKKNN